MEDWNNDGKEDWEDFYFFQQLVNESDSRGSAHFSGSGGGFFKIVVGICIGIIVLALLLGVSIPGSVIQLLLEVIFIAGIIALCMKK